MNTLYQLKGGFDDPPITSQAVFRNLLDAMAMPGRVVDLGAVCESPDGLSGAAAAVALTLVDFETPLWIAPDLKEGEQKGGGEIEQWLKFHCGCPITDTPSKAAFAISTRSMSSLAAFNAGDAKYPDLSTTVLLEVESLTDGEAVELEGPGIREVASIRPSGLPARFWSDWATNGSAFQFGVDVFLCSGDAVIGLPRTLRLASPQI